MRTAPTRVLIVHNAYLHLGGEDGVVRNEMELLRAHDHSVDIVRVSNERLKSGGVASKLDVLVGGGKIEENIDSALQRCRPDLIHVHNWMPQVTTAPYSCAARVGIPVVQTLHNYRLVCLNGLMLRDGVQCQLCVRKGAWPGVWYGCYRGSRLQSAGAALLQRRMRHAILRGAPDALIAVSNFQKNKLLNSGWIPNDRLWVKPNFVEGVPPNEIRPAEQRTGLLYVGRLSREKGLHIVISALQRLRNPPPLTVLGDGPERDALAAAARGLPVQFFGAVEGASVRRAMCTASILVVPSVWYEAMPLTVLEAMSTGLPVVVSAETGAAEAVGTAGWLAPPGDDVSWAGTLEDALNDLTGRKIRGREAVRRYKALYSPEASYQGLMKIYGSVLHRRN